MGAPFLDNGILVHNIFWRYEKNFRSLRSIFALLFAPQVFTELPLGSSRREGAPFLSNGILAPYIFRSYDKKFQKSTINICLVVCILAFAPQVYIELPLGSSRSELHFWAMGYWLLTYSEAMIKISEVYDQYLPCRFNFSICSPGVY